jgi:bifunctional enzyme CysN/CysC
MRVSLFWLGKQPLTTKKTFYLKLGTAKERAQIETIHNIIDASDYGSVNGKTEINHHDVAEVTFKLAHPIAFDTSDKLPDTSRFVIVDEYEIRGGGIVIEALPDEESQLREDIFLRNQKWIRSTVNSEQRAERYNQKSSLVIVTGPKGVGRKRLASMLEQHLFDSGKLAYYMGIGSLLYGVNADLKHHKTPGDWRENVRRFAEVAHLFLDAGMIMIVTAVELTQADLNIIKAVIGEEKIETIWLGEDLTTDITYDLIFHHNEPLEEATVSIKRLLQDHGVIFKA